LSKTMGDERETIDYDRNAGYELEQRSDDELSSCDGKDCYSQTASEGTSVSEMAGQRLYMQALETRKKIENARERKTSISEPQLKMATRGRTSRDPSPSPIPRYLQLYEHSKVKKILEPEICTGKPPKSVVPNVGCNRLYALSASKQQEGKERREEIIKSKIKPPPPYLNQKKISVDEAAKIYDRGMKHLISLEMKRIEAAVKSEVPYKSPLVRVGTDDDNVVHNG